MKGFKPTGYGPSSGFKYPASFGFTGSTGNVTQVSPYTRRAAKPYIEPRGFASGGFVRQDNPRMKQESIGDQGSALDRRSRSYSNLDQVSGGKTPIRPGYKKGGKTKTCMASGGAVMGSAGHGPLSQMGRMKKGKKMPVAGAIKSKFYEKGGRVVRGSSAKSFLRSVADIPRLAKSVTINAADDVVRAMSKGQRTVEGRNQSIDEYAASTSGGRRDGMSNYSRGGKAKRMGYANGGGVSAGQAKQIAERTVGEHVRYPAPKGHKGLSKSC